MHMCTVLDSDNWLIGYVTRQWRARHIVSLPLLCLLYPRWASYCEYRISSYEWINKHSYCSLLNLLFPTGTELSVPTLLVTFVGGVLSTNTGAVDICSVTNPT